MMLLSHHESTLGVTLAFLGLLACAHAIVVSPSALAHRWNALGLEPVLGLELSAGGACSSRSALLGFCDAAPLTPDDVLVVEASVLSLAGAGLLSAASRRSSRAVLACPGSGLSGLMECERAMRAAGVPRRFGSSLRSPPLLLAMPLQGDLPMARRIAGLRANAALMLGQHTHRVASVVVILSDPVLVSLVPLVPGAELLHRDGPRAAVRLAWSLLQRFARLSRESHELWPTSGVPMNRCTAEAFDLLPSLPAAGGGLTLGNWLFARAASWVGVLRQAADCHRAGSTLPSRPYLWSCFRGIRTPLRPRGGAVLGSEVAVPAVHTAATASPGLPFDLALPCIGSPNGSVPLWFNTPDDLPPPDAAAWLLHVGEAVTFLLAGQWLQRNEHRTPHSRHHLRRMQRQMPALLAKRPLDPSSVPAPARLAESIRELISTSLALDLSDSLYSSIKGAGRLQEGHVWIDPPPQLPLPDRTGAEVLRAAAFASGRQLPLRVAVPPPGLELDNPEQFFTAVIEGLLHLQHAGLVRLVSPETLTNGTCDGVALIVRGVVTDYTGEYMTSQANIRRPECIPLVLDQRDRADAAWLGAEGKWAPGHPPSWWPSVTGVRTWALRGLGAPSGRLPNMLHWHRHGCGGGVGGDACRVWATAATSTLLPMPTQPGSFVLPSPFVLDSFNMLGAVVSKPLTLRQRAAVSSYAWQQTDRTVQAAHHYFVNSRAEVARLRSEAVRPVLVSCSLLANEHGGPRWWALRWVRRFAREQGLPICTTPEQCLQDGGVWVGLVSGNKYFAEQLARPNLYMQMLLHSQVVVTAAPANWDGDLRLFEAVAGGAAVMSDRLWNPLLAQTFVDGDSMVMYDTPNTATTDNSYEVFREKLLGLLQDGARRRRLAARAWEVAMRYHTPEERVAQLLAAAVAVDTAEQQQGGLRG